MERWPSQFPLPTSALNLDGLDNAVRTTMEAGTVRQRRRFTVEALQVKATWELSDVELEVFTAFHKHRINLGNDWFVLPMPSGGGIKDHVVRMVQGKFSQDYQNVGRWRVSATLDVRDRETLSSAVLDVFVEIGTDPDSLAAFVSAVSGLHAFVHVTLPSDL